MRMRVLFASPPVTAVKGVASHTSVVTRGLRGAVACDTRWPVIDRPKPRFGQASMHEFAGVR